MLAFVFVGPSVRRSACVAGKALRFLQCLPRLYACIAFDIQQAGFGCRPALCVDAGYCNVIVIRAALNGEPVSDMYRPTGFDPVTIDMYLAAADGCGGERAGFEEARGPEPFIESYRFHTRAGREFVTNITVLLEKKFLGVLLTAALAIVVVSDSMAETSVEVELDPYYSNAGFYIGLTDKPLPEISAEQETEIYQKMLSSIYTAPRFMVFELSVNPLPVLGVYTKKNHRNFYNSFDIGGNGLNLFQALTEGFEEPYAASIFLGSIVRFVEPGEDRKTKNKGYTGYLLNVGDKHILNNDLIDDDWYELEWKIKGDQDYEEKTLSWSLRAGLKNHSNADITDVIYFGLRRNHFDAESDTVSFIDNSDIDFKVEFAKTNFSVVQTSFFIDKKWSVPFTVKSNASFGIGLILDRGKYSGSLANSNNDVRLILRPSLKF